MRTTLMAFLCANIFLLALIVGPVDVAHSEEPDTQSVEITLNLGEIIEFAESNKNIAMLLQRAIGEAVEGVRIQNLEQAIAAANDVVGMDIKTDAHSLSVSIGSDLLLRGNFALDVAPISAVLHTAKQGNLEGLLLMSPTYSSEKSNDGTLHVMQVGPEQNVYLKFIESSSGVFTVAAMNEDRVNSVSKQLSKKQRSPSDSRSNELIRASVGEETFKKVASELSSANSPQANIVRNIISEMRELTLVVSREGDGVSINLASSLNSEEKAKQQSQALQGGKAIAKMFLESEGSNPMVKNFVEILDSLEIDHDEKNVTASIVIPSVSEAMELIENF